MPIQCPHCGRETPDGQFCVHCGAPLGTASEQTDSRRRQAFAADPREHVYHPSVVSTLAPHLNPRRTLQARWLLLGGAFVVFLIGLGRLVPLSIVLAALLVPILYLLYFYDVEIYEDEPLVVLAGTFAAGLVLGAAMSLVFYRVILGQFTAGLGPSAGYVLLTAVGLPILGQALMLVGPVILYVARPRYDDLLDGLAFGAASGLGFACAQSIVYSWLLIAGPFQRGGPSFSWALPILRVALLVPLLNAASTGLICASLWFARDQHPPRRTAGLVAALPVVVGAGFAAQIIPALGSDLLYGQILTLVWYGATLFALILALRMALHAGLLEKARELGHGGELICPHCHRRIPDGPFCPYCGIALRSLSKRSRRPLLRRQEGDLT